MTGSNRATSGLPTIREPSRVVSQIEVPSATTSAGSASTRHKPDVFPPAIVSIRRFGYTHLLRSVGTASSIHTGARSALTCCFPKGIVPSFLLETKMACHVGNACPHLARCFGILPAFFTIDGVMLPSIAMEHYEVTLHCQRHA